VVLLVLAIVAFYATTSSSKSRALNFFAIRFTPLFLSARDILTVFCQHRICKEDGLDFRSLDLLKGFGLCRCSITLYVVVENPTSRKSRGKVTPVATFLFPKPLLPDRLRTLALLPFLGLVIAFLLRPRSVRLPCTKYNILIASSTTSKISTKCGTGILYPGFSTSHCNWQAGRSGQSSGQDLDSCTSSRTCL
jgi:hypothetical protein